MKKLLSYITAFCLSASMAAPMVSNAIFNLQDSDSPALECFKDTEKYMEIDSRFKALIFPKNDEEIKDAVLYSNLSGSMIYALIPTELMGYSEDEIPAVFNLTEGTTVEQVNTLLSEKFGEEYEITLYNHNSNYKYQFDGKKEHFKEVCQLLKAENFIDKFVIPSGFIQIKEYSTTTEQGFRYCVKEEQQYDVLEKYVTENKLGELTLEEKNIGSTTYLLEKLEFETIEEKYDIALDIFNQTDLMATFDSPVLTNNVEIENIDVFNSVDGDANCDNAATMADAAAILQAIGNPDKYALSRQGEFNADYANDGLTADDAIAIQKKLAGIE